MLRKFPFRGFTSFISFAKAIFASTQLNRGIDHAYSASMKTTFASSSGQLPWDEGCFLSGFFKAAGKNRRRSLSKKTFCNLLDWKASSPAHGHPLQILLESCGFRPQNLQGSDFSGEKSAPVVAVHAAGHDWNLRSPLVLSLRFSTVKAAGKNRRRHPGYAVFLDSFAVFPRCFAACNASSRLYAVI